MAFMEKLSEKLTSGANAVQSFAKEKTDQFHVSSEISMNTNEIDKRYKQIGMCVKDRLLPQINDSEVLQLAKEIDDLLARNQTLSGQLNNIKGTRHCTVCGAELKPEAVFCQKCGSRNDNTQQQAPMQAQPQQFQQQAPVQQPQHKTVSVRPANTSAAQTAQPEFTSYNANPAPAPAPVPVPTPAPEATSATEQHTADYSEFQPAPAAEPTPDPEQPTQAAEQTPAPEQPLTSCPYCGCAKNLGKFCPGCGKKLK